jgi:hypothetical protein
MSHADHFSYLILEEKKIQIYQVKTIFTLTISFISYDIFTSNKIYSFVNVFSKADDETVRFKHYS